MDHPGRSRTVKPFVGNAALDLGGLQVPALNRLTDFTDLRSQGAFNRAIGGATFFVLTESLLGTD